MFSVAETSQQKPQGLLGTATSTFTQLLNSDVQCCLTSTETTRLIRDGHLDFHTALMFSVALRQQKSQGLLGTAASTFTQLLSSERLFRLEVYKCTVCPKFRSASPSK